MGMREATVLGALFCTILPNLGALGSFLGVGGMGEEGLGRKQGKEESGGG